MVRFELVNGEVVELAEGDKAAFLERVRKAVEDPAVTVAKVVELIYGAPNAVLVDGLMPDGRQAVTEAVLDDPAYRVLQDLLGRKERAEHGPGPPLPGRYSLSVTMAAEVAGVHVSAIRQAIAAGKLDAQKVPGSNRWRLDPASVREYAKTSRAPGRVESRPLAIVVGSEPGRSFRLKHDGRLVDELEHGSSRLRKKGQKPGEARHIQATIVGWSRAAVVEGEKEGALPFYEYLEVQPSPYFQVLKRPGSSFYVAGWFELVRKLSGERSANEAFRAFDPESDGLPGNVPELGGPEQLLDDIATDPSVEG